MHAKPEDLLDTRYINNHAPIDMNSINNYVVQHMVI